jgi:hypothetical protein
LIKLYVKGERGEGRGEMGKREREAFMAVQQTSLPFKTLKELIKLYAKGGKKGRRNEQKS